MIKSRQRYRLLNVALHARLKLSCAGRYGLNVGTRGVGRQCIANLSRFLTRSIAAAVVMAGVVTLRSILVIRLVALATMAIIRIFLLVADLIEVVLDDLAQALSLIHI